MQCRGTSYCDVCTESKILNETLFVSTKGRQTLALAKQEPKEDNQNAYYIIYDNELIKIIKRVCRMSKRQVDSVGECEFSRNTNISFLNETISNSIASVGLCVWLQRKKIVS